MEDYFEMLSFRSSFRILISPFFGYNECSFIDIKVYFELLLGSVVLYFDPFIHLNLSKDPVIEKSLSYQDVYLRVMS